MATPASGRQVPIVGQIALSYALPLWRDRRKSNRSESRLHVQYAGAVRMVKSAGYHYTPHTLQARSSLLYGLPRRFAGRQLFVSGSPASSRPGLPTGGSGGATSPPTCGTRSDRCGRGHPAWCYYLASLVKEAFIPAGADKGPAGPGPVGHPCSLPAGRTANKLTAKRMPGQTCTMANVSERGDEHERRDCHYGHAYAGNLFTPSGASSLYGPTREEYERDNGLLSQWRGYGGENRFCIVFDSAALNKLLQAEYRAHLYLNTSLSLVQYASRDVSLPTLFPELLKCP